MTSETVSTESPASDDPLRRLHRRITRAQQPSADRVLTEDLQSNEEDPLEVLKRRIDEASDPASMLEPAAPPPIDELLEAFEHARALLDAPIGYLHDVDADDPIDRLHRQLDREADEIGRRPAIALPRTPTTDHPSTTDRPTDGDGTAAVGREVLAMLADRDLPGQTRAEAVRRLALAIESGNTAELREVLRLLIRG